MKLKGEYVFSLGDVPEMDVPELQLRYVTKGKGAFSKKITGAKDAEKILRKLIRKDEIELREQVIVLYLNNANKVIGYYRHTTGGLTSSLIDSRLILATALKSLSTSIILCHNHPSGTLIPSETDRQITRRMRTAALQMDITLLDHIIITKTGYYSFAEEKEISLNGLEKHGNIPLNVVLQGDVLKELTKIPASSIDCVVTSPPYWQLRDYGWKGQWGLEKTYSEYLNHLWDLMEELKRVLKPEGTVWINLGDSYFGSGNSSGQKNITNLRGDKADVIAPRVANNYPGNRLEKKCQVLIPHRFAVGCVERGWLVRNDIIWAKPNGLPESVRDRFSKRHEHIFLMVKQAKYYFDLDAVREEHKQASVNRANYAMTAYGSDPANKRGAMGKGIKGGGKGKKVKLNPLGKNPGDVTDFWAIATKPNSQKHYATFNTELITKPILAGCPKGGVVLDPFCGVGTTGVRAIELGRNFIGIEGKKSYCVMANRNIKEALKNQRTDLKALMKGLNELKFSKAA